MSSEKILEGSCLCGSVKIVLHGKPVKIFNCHCIDCQKSAGGPYQTCAIYPTSNLDIIDPKSYVKKYAIPKEQVTSGFEKHKFFCGHCATHLFNQPMKANGEKSVVKTGFLDKPEGYTGSSALDLLKPSAEIFTSDRPSFVPPIEGLKQFERAM